MEQTATVTITRPRALVAAARKFRVLCNGAEVARLANGSTASFRVPVGTHAVQIKSDWLGGKPLALTLRSGQTCHLICGSPGDVIQSFLATFFLPNTYLRPRIVDAGEHQAAVDHPRPAWGRAVFYLVVWTLLMLIVPFGLLTIFGSALPTPAQLSRAGQISGFLIVLGWAFILYRAYTRRL